MTDNTCRDDITVLMNETIKSFWVAIDMDIGVPIVVKFDDVDDVQTAIEMGLKLEYILKELT